MNRGIVLIVMLLMLVDLAEDGCPGSFKSGPLQAAVSHVLSHFPHYPFKKVDSSNLLSSSDWRDMFSSRQAEPVIPISQLPLKIITSCNNGSSGGIAL